MKQVNQNRTYTRGDSTDHHTETVLNLMIRIISDNPMLLRNQPLITDTTREMIDRVMIQSNTDSVSRSTASKQKRKLRKTTEPKGSENAKLNKKFRFTI